jgi:hypothetical protein
MQPDQNQYNFIMDPSNGKRSGGPSFLQNPKNRILAGILFIFSVIFILIIGFSIISSIGKKSNDSLITVAAYQTEIARISSLGLESAKDSSVRSKLATISAFIETDSKATISYLSSNGTKLSKQQVALALDKKADEKLETAAQLNKYDETLLQIIQEKSSSYKSALKQALNDASTAKEKQILETAANNILTFEGLDSTKTAE